MQLTNPKDVLKLGTILGVWAHPDDETYGCAGIMAQAVGNGQRVVCITATKGEAGSQDEERWPSATLGKLREQEMHNALQILGVTEHHWLDYPDGGCKDIPDDEAVGRIANFIRDVQPDTILTFEPNGITGHDDHRAISRWTLIAKELTDSAASIYCYVVTNEQFNDTFQEADRQFNMFFNTDEPVLVPQDDCDILLKLDARLHELKLRALQAMPSQTEAMFGSPLGQALMESMDIETFIAADKLT